MTKINHGISPFMSLKGFSKAAGVLAVGIMMSGCRGTISEKAPVHPNMNMDQQPRMEAQEVNNFFADGRSMRQPVEGTVARGYRKADTEYYEGVDENGEWIEDMPVEMTRAMLYRGKERYEIYCTPCHGITGKGDGIIMQGGYGYVPAPTYHQDRLREAPDGEIYSAIFNGVRTMPSYAHQVKVEDRWAIVAYIRALQASQNVTEEEIQAYDIDLSTLQAEYQAEQEKAAEIAAAKEAAAAETPVTVERGKELVTTYACESCHSKDGTAVIGPTWKNLMGHEVTVTTESGETMTLTVDEEYIKESILNPAAKIVEGFPPSMPNAYSGLSENDLLSIIEYIKTLSESSEH